MISKVFTFTVWIDKDHYYSFANELQINTLTIQERADTAFAEGKCEIITNQLSYNIPPYSILDLTILYTGATNTYDTKNYIISSNAIKHPQIEGLYIHQCKILEATSILETYTVGTKTFSLESSYKNDFTRIQKLIDLTSKKYKCLFTFDTNYSPSAFGNNEYSFGAGTTLFAALSEIALRNNKKVAVRSIRYEYFLDKINITLGFDSLTSPAFDITDFRIVDFQYNQSSENYCKYLETEAKNVVDRDTTQNWVNLTCRSNDIVIDSDHAVIQLPCNVEGITEFEVNTTSLTYLLELNLNEYQDFITPDWILSIGGSSHTVQGETIDYYKIATYHDWITYFDMLDRYGIHAGLDEIADEQLSWLTTLSNQTFELKYVVIPSLDNPITFKQTTSGTESHYIRLPVTQRLVEENEWNTLPANQKSTYAVYKSGSNTIYNLNANYKADLINYIIGQTTYNFLHYDYEYSGEYVDDWDADTRHITYELTTTLDSEDPLDYSYNVKAVSIIKPKLEINKKSNPINEPSWKANTRTYSNSANVIDFNMLVDDMEKKVEPLGNVELTLTLDTSNTSVYPKPNNKITFNENYYYIASLEHTYKTNVRNTQYYLSLQPLKIADSIGVDYQFNPIRLPYYNTVDRPLYFYYDREGYSSLLASELLSNLRNSNQILVRIDSYDSNSNLVSQIALRPSVVTDDDNVYVYAECVDNFSAGDKSIFVSSGKYESKAVHYADSNLEIEFIDIYIITTHELVYSNDVLNNLPDIDPEYFDELPYTTVWDIANDEVIYKDARERLTFTIKVKRWNN